MNVYDFDNTIYDGESAFDFFKYCLKKKPVLLKVLFPIVWDLIKYKSCRMSVEEFHQRGAYYTETFFTLFDDIYAEIREFWDKNQHKIKPFYKEVQKEDDVIITANVNILVEEMLGRMGVKHYIATTFDMDRGKLVEICFSDVKVRRFKEEYGGKIDDFYTDSMNDAPLMDLAQRVYMVKGNKVSVYKEKEL